MARKVKRPKLAEVHPIKEVDEGVVEVLTQLLDLAESGQINSLRIIAEIDRQANYIQVGEAEDLSKSIGTIEIMKAHLLEEMFCQQMRDSE